jgi:hypothetical protein
MFHFKRLMFPILLGLGLSAQAEQASSRGISSWEIGPDVYYYQYEEAPFMEMTGWMVGGSLHLTRYIPLDQIRIASDPLYPGRPTLRGNHFAMRLDARYATGKADYDGELIGGDPYEIKNIRNSAYEGRILAGFLWPQRLRVSAFYLGYGYRLKEDDSSFDEAGYLRESSYSYVPVLFELRHLTGRGGEIAYIFEYDYFLRGRQRSDLRDFGLGQVRDSQGDGHGIRIAISFRGEAQGFAWVIEPYARWWKIKGSDPNISLTSDSVLVGFEPQNDTIEAGLSIRLMFN